MADEPQPFDATDPAAIANAERDSTRHVRQDADAIRWLLKAKNGRAFFYRRLQLCHIYSSTFAPGQPDVTAFQLGEENVGKKLMMEAMDASPDLYMLMIKEQREESKRLDEVRRTEQKNREQAERGTKVEELMPDLPPPAGWPGGPPLPKKKDS